LTFSQYHNKIDNVADAFDAHQQLYLNSINIVYRGVAQFGRALRSGRCAIFIFFN
jgi:hypothetical protein